MSYVSKTYEFLEKVESLFNRKMFKTVFIAISGMILFFGVMNVYAQEDIKISPDWDGTKTFYNNASGVDDGTQDNMTSHSGQLGLNTAWVILSTMAPEYTEGADILSNNPNVPADMKLGLTGFSDSALAFVYENQSSVNVVAHLQDEWVPGHKESSTGLYAASGTNVSGYQSLIDSGIAPLWNQMRNIAYVFFVVIMIVIGFMIMFRSKLGGQTMVSIGNTIPSVITSLILVTFSFAIAGVIIDFGGVIVSLLYAIFQGQSISIGKLGPLFGVLFDKDLGTQFVNTITSDLGKSLQGFSSNVIGGWFKIVLSLDEAMVMGFVGILAAIIGAGIVLVGAIKLLIMLYKAYFELLLNIVIGPIMIMIGTLPGKENMKTNWFTSIVRNVLVFPIAYFIINIPIFLEKSTGVLLTLPDKLTGANLGTATTTATTISADSGYLGLIVAFALRVFVIYYACQAPKFAEAIVPVVETNKAAADAMAGARMGMSKIPLVGGLFSGK
jgi:hypothetical protein